MVAFEKAPTKTKIEMVTLVTDSQKIVSIVATPTLSKANWLQEHENSFITFTNHYKNFATATDVGWCCYHQVSNSTIFKEKLTDYHLQDHRLELYNKGILQSRLSY
jgi:hypothetical protein